MRSSETANEDFVPKYPTYKRGTKYANQELNNSQNVKLFSTNN